MKILNENQSDTLTPKVYESSGSGHTVYVRDSRSTERTLHVMDTVALSNIERIKEDKLWGEIRQAAKTNEVLRTAMDRVIMLYHLTEQKDGTK